MRFSVAILALAASAVSASVFPRQLPSCAEICSADAPMGSCTPEDNSCLCSNSNFITNSTLCIEQTCSASDATTAISVSKQICAAVGVTLTSTPVASSTGSSGASSSGSVTASKSASGSSASATSPASSSPSPSAAPANNGAAAYSISTVLTLAVVGLSAMLL